MCFFFVIIFFALDDITNTDEIETVECLGSVDIGTSTSDNISVTNAITPIQSHRDVSAARVIDLSTEDGEMDVTVEYNNGINININATQSSASPDKLKGSKDATIFAEAVSISPRSPSIHGLTGFCLPLFCVKLYVWIFLYVWMYG